MGYNVAIDGPAGAGKSTIAKLVAKAKGYISVDGGMPDNPRYALYQSPYTVINASRADKETDLIATIAGRCCESGDLLAEGIKLCLYLAFF